MYFYFWVHQRPGWLGMQRASKRSSEQAIPQRINSMMRPPARLLTAKAAHPAIDNRQADRQAEELSRAGRSVGGSVTSIYVLPSSMSVHILWAIIALHSSVIRRLFSSSTFFRFRQTSIGLWARTNFGGVESFGRPWPSISAP